MLQDSLLYFPEKAALADVVSGQLRAWPAADGFRGLLAEPAAPVIGTAVVFHGNAGHAGQRGFYASALTRLGLRVILAEYPGYGPRGGRVGEQPLVEDAQETLARARQLYGAPLLVVGESLGAGVAAAAVRRQAGQIDGLLLITPWDRLESVATHHYGWLPVGWLLHDRYDSVANLAGFDRPVAVVIAGKDAIVPAALGMALYESLSAPKRMMVVDGAGHNDWARGIGEAWWRESFGFLLGGG